MIHIGQIQNNPYSGIKNIKSATNTRGIHCRNAYTLRDFRKKRFRNDINGSIANYFPCFIWVFLTLIVVIAIILILSYQKKKRKIAAISSASIVILSSILVWEVIDHSNQVQEEVYWAFVASYTLKISSNSNQNYSLSVPYLMDPILLAKTKITSGTGQFEFATINGTPMTFSSETLKVRGHGNLTIHGSAHLNSIAVMSMKDNRTSIQPDYWVFCEKTYENQNISLYIRGNQGGRHWWSGIEKSDVQYVENGWNRIRVQYENVVP